MQAQNSVHESWVVVSPEPLEPDDTVEQERVGDGQEVGNGNENKLWRSVLEQSEINVFRWRGIERIGKADIVHRMVFHNSVKT